MILDTKIPSSIGDKTDSCLDKHLVSTSFEYPRHFAVSYLSIFPMHVRFVFFIMVAALSTPAIFAQGTNQPTVDELVAKNIEAKGGATALNSLQTLRSTGKLLVNVQGQIELGYLETK